MRRSRVGPLAVVVSFPLLVHVAVASPASGYPAPHPQAGTSVPAPQDGVDDLDSAAFRPGPIHVEDPATRARIELLYREQFDLRRDTLARVREIAKAGAATRDPEALEVMNREGMQGKHELERRTLELGLEIARLDGDEHRAAAFKDALDQFLHPEKWIPIFPLDPELQARRLRGREISVNPAEDGATTSARSTAVTGD